MVETELRQAARAALCVRGASAKLAATHALWRAAVAGAPLSCSARLASVDGIPGRPPRPALVAAGRVPRRSVHTPDGRAALLHAVAHIEFNAINLALDAVWRFPDLPAAYYHDWLRVADEEARHFALLRAHLHTLGHDYGDFAAHDGLWLMAERTAADVLARMALVPRVLEARGLDVAPAMRERLAAAGDEAAAAILDVILADEVGHVAIGTRWLRWVCAVRGLEPVTAAAAIARALDAPRAKPPLNLTARRAAGFEPTELARLAREAARGGRRT